MKEYLLLLVKREIKVVLGNHWSNLWLLTSVIFVTLLSIAFSNASITYLRDKMDDPFTKWVNIPKGDDEESFTAFRESLRDSIISLQYGYSNSQSDSYCSKMFVGRDKNSLYYLKIRFFEQFNSELVQAVLSNDNVINNCSLSKKELDSSSLGLIITKDALNILGYNTDSIPPYICFAGNSSNSDTLGLQLIDDRYFPCPLPILGVVKRLPMNMDMIASRTLDNYFFSEDKPFHFGKHPEYIKDLYFFYEGSFENFKNSIAPIIPKGYHSILPFEIISTSRLKSWKLGSIIKVNLSDSIILSNKQCEDFSDKVISSLGSDKVQRLYNYVDTDYDHQISNFVSVSFSSLDSIRPFEQYVKTQFGIQIEMTQINSKENFNAVSILANILSWVMISISLACIIIFIVNMLQSYFQKVKKNLGTFKAFGMDTKELIYIYILMLFAIVFIAVILAVVGESIIQVSLHGLGLLKENQYDYLSLWSESTVYWVIVILISATSLSVIMVMRCLLKQTPGNLIYER